MKQMMRAAFPVTPGTPFFVGEISVPIVRTGDVLVNVQACVTL